MTAMASRRAGPDRCTVSTLPSTGPVRQDRAATPPGPRPQPGVTPWTRPRSPDGAPTRPDGW